MVRARGGACGLTCRRLGSGKGKMKVPENGEAIHTDRSYQRPSKESRVELELCRKKKAPKKWRERRFIDRLDHLRVEQKGRGRRKGPQLLPPPKKWIKKEEDSREKGEFLSLERGEGGMIRIWGPT